MTFITCPAQVEQRIFLGGHAGNVWTVSSPRARHGLIRSAHRVLWRIVRDGSGRVFDGAIEVKTETVALFITLEHVGGLLRDPRNLLRHLPRPIRAAAGCPVVRSINSKQSLAIYEGMHRVRRTTFPRRAVRVCVLEIPSPPEVIHPQVIHRIPWINAVTIRAGLRPLANVFPRLEVRRQLLVLLLRFDFDVLAT